MYTWPPASWTASTISRMRLSKTPCVEGYVTISPQSSELYSDAFFFRSSTSMLPLGSHATVMIFMPAMAAEAGLVPWAEAGMRIMLR